MTEENPLPKLLTPGEAIKLREDTLPYVRVRNWTFQEMEKNGVILLKYKPKGYVLEVTENDIDWEAYRQIKESD